MFHYFFRHNIYIPFLISTHFLHIKRAGRKVKSEVESNFLSRSFQLSSPHFKLDKRFVK